MSVRLVVGVDGGATRTRVVLADAGGTEIARSMGGPGIIGEGEDERVVADVADQVRALVDANGHRLPVEALCAGFAGAAGRPEARRTVRARIEATRCARHVVVVSDSQVAFTHAFGAGPGILLIGGTGSVALGRAERAGVERYDGPEPRGREPDDLVRTGGWGRLLGDEGSAYALGLEGLRSAIRGAEDRGPETTLTERLFAEVAAAGPQEVFVWSEAVSKGQIAALAPVVVAAAEAGDAVSGALVDRTVSALVAHAAALRGRLGLDEPAPSVALVGGLVEPGGSLRTRIERALAADGFRVLDRAVDPATGAVEWAVRMAAGDDLGPAPRAPDEAPSTRGRSTQK